VQHIDSSAFVSLLQGCIKKKALSEGKLVHAHMAERGFLGDKLLPNKLADMYAKCGSVGDARRVFDQMLKRNVFSWNVMISAYAKHGPAEEALALFCQMKQMDIQPDPFIFASVLPACAHLAALDYGKEIHEEIKRNGFQSDTFVANGLVDMYAKCGRIEDARSVFDKMRKRDLVSWNAMISAYAQNGDVDESRRLFQEMPKKNVVSWTAMIAGYAQNGSFEEALGIYRQMQVAGVKPNLKTFASVIATCANLGTLDYGIEVHDEIIRIGFRCDVFVESALVDMYAKCGSLEKAREVFDKMHQRNAISWTAMLAGYAQNGCVDEALNLFQKMPQRDVVSWTAMIAGFAQNGYLDQALKLFQEMPKRNLVSWTAMIAGYVQNGHSEEALKIFRQMQQSDVKPDSNTYATVLPAFANLAALEQGMEIHEEIIKNGLQSDVFVANALVDMYAKCGSIENACNVFEKIHPKSVISWNTMIAGYSMHGAGKEALKLFEQMRLCNTKPNHVTLLSVLSACCHSGLVVEGWHFFHSMSQSYQITPSMEHYSCMVDLLGRAGYLNEALDFIVKMPIKPGATVWSCLLGACRIHDNIELAEHVAEQIFKLDPNNAAPYVLLSNIYAAMGKWVEREKVWKMMNDRSVHKNPGCSWIEVNKQVNAFLSGDESHPQTQEIYAELEKLSRQMMVVGYVANTKFVLNDVDEEQKEQILGHHSEKLAIAFGLINTSMGTTIRVIKNLRVCGDCHTAIKFISKLVAREIVVRDANRFHHFKDGWCSCRDYW
jgi:pentatricopeptide repeat protein